MEDTLRGMGNLNIFYFKHSDIVIQAKDGDMFGLDMNC